jgi:hypothetical protein
MIYLTTLAVSQTMGVRPEGSKTLKKKLRGLSPQANYVDRVTAACRRS